jgi:hypothetical protein
MALPLEATYFEILETCLTQGFLTENYITIWKYLRRRRIFSLFTADVGEIFRFIKLLKTSRWHIKLEVLENGVGSLFRAKYSNSETCSKYLNKHPNEKCSK